VELTHAKQAAQRINSYFNREGDRFCSHKHTPPNPDDIGVGVAIAGNTAYIAWNIFTDYAKSGSLHLKEVVAHLLDGLLGSDKTLRTNLPDRAVSTLTQQKQKNRYIHHLLFAHTTKRGEDIEIIESIVPLSNVEAALRVKERVTRVYLAPSGTNIPYEHRDDVVSYKIDSVDCHQMVVIAYE